MVENPDNSWFDKYLSVTEAGNKNLLQPENPAPSGGPDLFSAMPPHRIQYLRRLFPDLDGEPGKYCTACLGTELEVLGQRVVCSRCGRWVRWK